MDEPTELISLESMIHEVYPNYDTDAIIQVRTVRPTRTFLEKAFLLCEEFQKENPRTLRMTRHLYDLYKLAQTPFATEALEDVELYHKIVQHREAYYHIKYVNYSMRSATAALPVEKTERFFVFSMACPIITLLHYYIKKRVEDILSSRYKTSISPLVLKKTGDFMFRLTIEEWKTMSSQFAITSPNNRPRRMEMPTSELLQKMQ